jgi:uncharacterized SAM-binding protein YcdF (DUF218 family)
MSARRRGFFHYLWLGFKISLLLVLANALFSIGQVYYYSRLEHTQTADAAIVLGAAAWDKRPSPVFRERINHAITLYQQKQVAKLIFTGGTPKPGFMTEAEVGRRYAMQQGVPADDILYENRSRDTWQNLVNAQQVAADNNINSLIIVSDPYHMARAAVMAKDLGLNAETSPTPTSRYSATQSKLRFLLQESYLLTVYQWVEWGSKLGLRFHPHP